MPEWSSKPRQPNREVAHFRPVQQERNDPEFQRDLFSAVRPEHGRVASRPPVLPFHRLPEWLATLRVLGDGGLRAVGVREDPEDEQGGFRSDLLREEPHASLERWTAHAPCRFG